MTWLLELEDRGVVVTGAAGGIGRAIVRQLADAGARVLAVDLDLGAAEDALVGVEGADRHAAAATDLTDLESHAGLLEQAVSKLGRVDALAHAAARLRRRESVEDVTEEDWDFQLDTNLKATFFIKPVRDIAQHELVAHPVTHENGWMPRPQGDGLGIEVLEDVVDRFRLDR